MSKGYRFGSRRQECRVALSRQPSSMLEPRAVKMCAVSRDKESSAKLSKVQDDTLRRPPYLNPKGGGDKSMDGKRELEEGMYPTVPRRLGNKVKAKLPESQLPRVDRAPVGSMSETQRPR